jgi:hypothetical protein
MHLSCVEVTVCHGVAKWWCATAGLQKGTVVLCAVARGFLLFSGDLALRSYQQNDVSKTVHVHQIQ